MQDQQQIGPIGEIKHHSHYHPLVVAPLGVEIPQLGGRVQLGLDHPHCQIHNHPQAVAHLEAEMPLEDLDLIIEAWQHYQVIKETLEHWYQLDLMLESQKWIILMEEVVIS